MPKRRIPAPYHILLYSVISLSTACANLPEQISDAELQQRANEDLQSLFPEPPSANSQITLPEAIARSIKYNLDNRLKMLESVVAQQRLEISDYNKLPQLAASAGYDVRDKRQASSSLNLNTGVQNFGASTSLDKGIATAQLQASWNTLDFGIAYLNTKQAGNEALIAIERQRKTLHNIIRDVHYAYWRVATAEPMQTAIDNILVEIQQGLKDSYAAQQAKLKPLAECLEYQRAMLDLQRQMQILKRDAVDARVELTALIGLPPFSQFKVSKVKKFSVPAVDISPTELKRLHTLALLNRPELREEDYKRRNAVEEVKKARFKMIPGMELFTGYNNSDNSFLLNHSWSSVGYRVTWNLINLISGPKMVNNALSTVDLADLRRRALSVAVMTQVDIAAYHFQQMKQELSLAMQLYRVDDGMYKQFVKQHDADQIDQLTMIQAKARRMVSALRSAKAVAEWQNSINVLYNSVGYQPATLLDHRQSLSDLTNQVKEYTKKGALQSNRHFIVPKS